MLHNNWDNATEEQKLRIEKFKIDIEKAAGNKNIASNTVQIMDDINDKG